MAEDPEGVLTDPTQDGALTDPTQDGAFTDDGSPAPIFVGDAAYPGALPVPVSLVVLSMGYCGRVFGNSPCLATGTPCFNTWPTCKYLSVFQDVGKDYKFTPNALSGIPFDGPRPYVASVKPLPTEIKTNTPVGGRLIVEMLDEPDGDVGIDPYLQSRSYFPDIPGTYWKKWLARNKNYNGRMMRYYEGLWGQTEDKYILRFVGRCDSITRKDASVMIEAVDLLKDLSSINVPPKLDLKLFANIDATQASITLAGADIDQLASSSGTLMIDKEVLTYVSVDLGTGTLTGTGTLAGAVRGLHGSEAIAHNANAKAQPCIYFEPMNPFDRIKSLILTQGGVDPDFVDSEAIDYWRDFPGDEPEVSCLLVTPTKLSDLIYELVDLIDCKIWEGENCKITMARSLPNDPSRSLTPFSDGENIVTKSASYDQNEKNRLTRIYLYWDKDPLGSDKDVSAYGRLNVGIDADAESPAGYGRFNYAITSGTVTSGGSGVANIAEKIIFSQWLHSEGQVEEFIYQSAVNMVMRQVWRNRDASPIIAADAALKDAGIHTGDWLLLSTDEILDMYGFAVDSVQFQVVRRENKGSTVTLLLLRGAQNNIGFIAPDSAPDWSDATVEDKKYAYICADDGTLPTNQPAFFIY